MVSSSQPTQIKVLKPRLKICAVCKSKLHLKYQQDKKTVYHLDKTCIVWRYAYQCLNKQCRWKGKTVLAPRAGLKHHSIGYDLLHFIGTARINHKLKLEEIQTLLAQEHAISLSIKQISNLADKYLQLISNRPHSSTLNNLRSRGNVILSIDGVRPQKANTTLYLIREVVSGQLLLAKVVVNSATNHIIPLYQSIKSMKLPVVGIVSDKQSSLVLAAKQTFPAIPHQYCHYHYLRNISKQFEEADRRLRKQIRKQFSSIYQTSKTLDANFTRRLICQDQFDIIKEFYQILKASSRQSSHYPFKPIGIKLYEQVVHVAKSLKVMIRIEKLKFFETIEKHITSIISQNKILYKQCQEQLKLIQRISELLKERDDFTGREAAEKRLMEFVDQTIAPARLQSWWTEVRKQTKAFLPGLFSFFLVPGLPRTNNAMERYIKDLKSDFIRILGRKFIHRFFLRRAEFWAFARELELEAFDEVIERLKAEDRSGNLAMKQRFNLLKHHFVLERRCVVNFSKQLNKLVKRWYITNR